VQNENIDYVALDLGYDSWEYTWWVLLKNKNPHIKISILTNCDTTDSYQLIISDQPNCIAQSQNSQLFFYVK